MTPVYERPFYNFPQTRANLTHELPASSRGEKAGRVAGAAIAEAVVFLPRVVAGMPVDRMARQLASTTSLRSAFATAGLWGSLNLGVSRTAQLAGKAVGATVGAITCLAAACLGYNARAWIAGAAQTGARVGELVARLPVDASEILRFAVADLMNQVVYLASRVFGAVGDTLNGMAELAMPGIGNTLDAPADSAEPARQKSADKTLQMNPLAA